MPSLDQWLTHTYAQFDHKLISASGSSLVFAALSHSERKYVILPAFTCHTLSFAALAAGKEVIHVDVAQDSLFCDRESLGSTLSLYDQNQVVLLVDHVFGYVCPWLSEIKQSFPDLLILEDCVRALGATVGDLPVGRVGDCTLLSMYKSTPGNDHGAILLSDFPLEVENTAIAKTALKTQLYNISLVRKLYSELVKKKQVIEDPPETVVSPNAWEPSFEGPDSTALARFETQLERLPSSLERSKVLREKIEVELECYSQLKVVRNAPFTSAAPYFVSFLVREGINRNALVTFLQKNGFFLLRTWDLTPYHFKELRKTFASVPEQSNKLSKAICHIYLPDLTLKRVDELTTLIGRFVSESKPIN